MTALVRFHRQDQQKVEWLLSPDVVQYEQALDVMQERVRQIQENQALEQV